MLFQVSFVTVMSFACMNVYMHANASWAYFLPNSFSSPQFSTDTANYLAHPNGP